MHVPVGPNSNSPFDPREDAIFILLGQDVARLQRVRACRRRSSRRTTPRSRGARS